MDDTFSQVAQADEANVTAGYIVPADADKSQRTAAPSGVGKR